MRGPALVVDALRVAALRARATLLLKGIVQTFGELPESSGSRTQVLVLLFQPLNGFHASLEWIVSVLIGHSPPYAVLFDASKKDAYRP